MPLCGENAFGCVKLQVWNRIKWARHGGGRGAERTTCLCEGVVLRKKR